MKTYLALLRGINVGGNNKVEMARLKETFEDLGFTNVRTFIASGNVIFQTNGTNTALLTEKIEKAIHSEFNIHSKVLIKDHDSIKKLVKAIPETWVNNTEMKCDVMFLWDDIDRKEILQQLPFDPKVEDILYVPGAVIWRIDRDKATKSKMFKIVGTKLHQQITVRNPNTVRKLYKMMLNAS